MSKVPAGPPLWRQGFRPFFLGAGIWAPAALAVWVLALAGSVAPPTVLVSIMPGRMHRAITESGRPLARDIRPDTQGPTVGSVASGPIRAITQYQCLR